MKPIVPSIVVYRYRRDEQSSGLKLSGQCTRLSWQLANRKVSLHSGSVIRIGARLSSKGNVSELLINTVK